MNTLQLVMIGVVILFIGGACVYWVDARRNNPILPAQQLSLAPTLVTSVTDTQAPALSPTLSPNPIEKPNTTTSWEFFSSQFGYMIQYPKFLAHTSGGGLPYDIQLTNTDITMTFIVVGLPSTQTARNYANSFCPPGAGAASRSQIQTIGFGIPVYRTPAVANSHCQEAVIALQKQQLLVDIQATITTPLGNTLFDQILTTFRFMAQ